MDEDEDEDEDDITNTITVRPLSLSGAPGAVVPLGLGPITTNFTVAGNAAFTSAGVRSLARVPFGTLHFRIRQGLLTL